MLTQYLHIYLPYIQNKRTPPLTHLFSLKTMVQFKKDGKRQYEACILTDELKIDGDFNK